MLWVLAIGAWLLGGYIAVGIAQKSDVDEWRRLNPRVLEHGEVLREPAEYDRTNAWASVGAALFGFLSLVMVLLSAVAERRKNSKWRMGFRWWNPFPWFSRR